MYLFDLPYFIVAHLLDCQCEHTIDDLVSIYLDASVRVNALHPMILFMITS